MSDEHIVDETVLRHALRLDPDERLPRLDPAVLRAIAERERGSWLTVGARAAFAVVALAAALAVMRVSADVAALVTAGDALDIAVRILALGAAPLELIWSVVAQPTTPLAILAAVLVAILYERRLPEREERHVRPS